MVMINFNRIPSKKVEKKRKKQEKAATTQNSNTLKGTASSSCSRFLRPQKFRNQNQSVPERLSCHMRYGFDPEPYLTLFPNQ